MIRPPLKSEKIHSEVDTEQHGNEGPPTTRVPRRRRLGLL